MLHESVSPRTLGVLGSRLLESSIHQSFSRQNHFVLGSPPPLIPHPSASSVRAALVDAPEWILRSSLRLAIMMPAAESPATPSAEPTDTDLPECRICRAGEGEGEGEASGTDGGISRLFHPCKVRSRPPSPPGGEWGVGESLSFPRGPLALLVAQKHRQRRGRGQRPRRGCCLAWCQELSWHGRCYVYTWLYDATFQPEAWVLGRDHEKAGGNVINPNRAGKTEDEKYDVTN